MKIMGDLDAVHLGLDENEADIAEELQDFDDSFDTRSEASESGSESSDSQPSISSVSSVPSSNADKRKSKVVKKKDKNSEKKATKRAASPNAKSGSANGKNSTKKKKESDNSNNVTGQKPHVESAAESKKLTKSAESTKKSKKKPASSASTNNATVNNNTSATTDNVSNNKSDASDVEDKKTTDKPQFDSDSESENSDSAANIKRNGRKVPSKSASPEKKILSGGGANSSKSNVTGKSYDYMTKINYLFRDTRFFLIKSNNADNIALSKSKNVWATLPQNDANLNQAFKEARNILLIFSVNESGKFAGFARMSGLSRRDIPQVAWILPPSISAKALGGVIEIDWISRKELSFNCTSHLYNSWNEGKPVKIGRDGQEIEPKVGAELCRLFPEDEKVELTPILRKSKETAKTMREKGIRVIYKAPRSLSARGGRGSGGPASGGGSYRHGDRKSGSEGSAMRHRRSYGPPHRGLPYKPPPGMVYKRAMSPYRGGGPSQSGSGGGGGSRTGGGDAGLPPWERYMTSAAAAEAYVADYMRTMHGQLPPFPFVPPLGQMPLPGAGSVGGGTLPPTGGPSIYDQMPPPVRYYDGPPLPDYPPPQPMRPPPPNFDKPPSYEDFAVWKNAGLPTVSGALPPGFPNFGNSSLSSSNGGGSGPSGAGGSGIFGGSSGGNGNTSIAGNGGPGSYRSSNNRGDNLNRGREQRGRDYHHRGGGSAGGSSRSGDNRDRHFRAGGPSERGGVHHRQYRDSGGRR